MSVEYTASDYVLYSTKMREYAVSLNKKHCNPEPSMMSGNFTEINFFQLVISLNYIFIIVTIVNESPVSISLIQTVLLIE